MSESQILSLKTSSALELDDTALESVGIIQKKLLYMVYLESAYLKH